MDQFDLTFGPGGSRRREGRPFVLGVLAGLSADPSQPPVAARRFLSIDVDNFDDRLAAMQPRLSFSVPNGVTGKGDVDVELAFQRIEDFEPAAVTSQVAILTKLWTARTRLVSRKSTPDGRHAKGTPQMAALLVEVLDDPALAEAILPRPEEAPRPAPEPEAPSPEAGGSTIDDLARLLKKGVGDLPAKEPPSRVQPILDEAVADSPRISDAAVQTIDALIERIDDRFARLLSAVLHHADFQRLEAAWRGLHYLVTNADTDETLQLRVMNLSREELPLALAGGDESPLWLAVRDGGFALLAGDYAFCHEEEDVAVMTALARLAAGTGTRVIVAAAPALLGLDTWQGMQVTRDLVARLQDGEHAAWQQFRAGKQARRVVLTLPRILTRLPYGAKWNPPEGLIFEEQVDVARPADFAWMNAAYGLGVVLCRAFREHGWDAAFAAGQESCEIDGLPFLTWRNADGDTEVFCPTEVAIPVEHGVALANCGLSPLLYRKNTDHAIFASVPPLQ